MVIRPANLVEAIGPIAEAFGHQAEVALAQALEVVADDRVAVPNGNTGEALQPVQILTCRYP